MLLSGKLRSVVFVLGLIGITRFGSAEKESFGVGWPTVDMREGKSSKEGEAILTGADQLELYLPQLKGKRVGLLVNQTAVVKNKFIVDALREKGVDIKLIFGPEH